MFIPSQGLFSSSTATVSRLEGHEVLGGDTARADDPNCQSNIPFHIPFHAQYGSWGEMWPGAAAQELAGHQLTSGEQWYCASLVLSILIKLLLLLLLSLLLFSLSSVPLNCLYLKSLLPFSPSNSLPHPSTGQWVSGCVELSCSWGWTITQIPFSER